MVELTEAFGVADRNLVVQCPEIVNHAKEEKAERKQVKDTTEPLAHVHAVNTEYTQKRQ